MLPHPDGLAAAKACATPGRCLFCEEPLRPGAHGRPRLICGAYGCWRAYQRSYQRDRREGVCVADLNGNAALAWCAGGSDALALPEEKEPAA